MQGRYERPRRDQSPAWRREEERLGTLQWIAGTEGVDKEQDDYVERLKESSGAWSCGIGQP